MALRPPPPRTIREFNSIWKDWLYFLWDYLTTVDTDSLKIANNLSDVDDVQTSLNNLDIDGTQNYLPKFNATDGLDDSAVSEDGSEIAATDRTFVLTGTTGPVPTVIESAGTHLAWIPSLEAFRAGTVTGTEWSTANIGTRSTVFGNRNIGSGNNTLTSGSRNTNAGRSSFVSGLLNDNSGFQCIVGGGSNTIASAVTNSLCCGGSNVLNDGDQHMVAGSSNTIDTGAAACVVAGNINTVSNYYCVALGLGNTVSGYAGIAFGVSNDLSGFNDNAIGQQIDISVDQGTGIGNYINIDATGGVIIGNGVNGTNKLDSVGQYELLFGSNSDLPALIITDGGGISGISDIEIPNDDEKLYFGALQDASFTYSAAGNLEANPKEVGTGYFNILGDLVVDENLTVGSGATGIDYTLTFNGENNDGLITWMEDEDYFNVADVILASDKIAFTQTDLNEYIDSLNDGYIDYKATTGHRFGTDSDSTNYTNIANDGTITLNGNARVTKHLSIQNFDLGKGTTTPTQVILGNYTGWEYTIGDDSVVSIDLPHDADYSADFNIYIRWYINEAYATNNGEIQWQVDWSATATDETEAVDSPGSSGTLTTGDINIPATAKYLTETSALTIGAANIADNSDLLGLTISRIAITGTDPTADPVIVSVHIEYTSNKLGT